METKTIVKVISLYDLIADNLLILLATLHHIIILAFNYYYIYTLEEFIDENGDEYYPIIGDFLTNLEFCQTATIITFAMLFLVIAANDDQVQLNQNRVLIMFVSYVIKLIYSLNKGWYYKTQYDTLKEITQFREDYIILLFASYHIRVVAFIVIIAASIIACMCEIFPNIIRFTKNYKFTFVQRKKNQPRNS